jgi:hypothetical protein
MKTVIFLSVFSAFTTLFCIMLVWYVKKILTQLIDTSSSVEEFFNTIDDYYEHLEIVNNMETYHGDETIEYLLKHTRAVLDELEEFKKIYSSTMEAAEEYEEPDYIEEELDDDEEWEIDNYSSS